MPYATKADVLAMYDQAVVDRLCWSQMAKAPDYSKIEQGLSNAATEIDSFVSTRYQVPLEDTPAILKQINIDLGIYYVALTADKLTDQITARATYWRSWLTLLARGQVGLGVTIDPAGDPIPADQAPPGPSAGMWTTAKRVN